ncbi:MAG: DUF5111 domain-containing protein, partial [Candidatus Cryptobacteroides sp.]
MMKNRIAVALLAAFALTACEKDGEKLIVTSPEEPGQFSASPLEIILESSARDALATTFVWNEGAMPTVSDPSVNLPDDLVSTVLQLSDTETFSNTVDTPVSKGATNVQFTVEQLNQVMMKLGFSDSALHDVFARLAVTMGSHTAYSDVLNLRIAPYTIEKKISIVSSSDFTIVAGDLVPKAATPLLYEGFAYTPSGWYNCFFLASDGTVWGCNENWTAFSLVPDSSNNCWFAEPSGVQYVFADTENGLWYHISIPTVDAVVGAETTTLKYSKSAGALTGTVTLSADSEILLKGNGARFDITTGTDAGIPGIEYPFCLEAYGTDGFVFTAGTSTDKVLKPGKAGTFTLRLDITTCTWSLEEVDPDAPVVTYPDYVTAYYYKKESTEKLSVATVFSKTDTDGIYEGFIYTDPAWGESYSNFRFETPDGTVYGTSDHYNLSDSGWNIWEDTPGLHYVTVDLTTMTWSTSDLLQIAVSGDFNGWGTSDVMTFDLASGKWVIECDVTFIEWGLKFTIGNADDYWKWTYADSDLDGVLNISTDNIIPSSTGKYRFELVLSSFSAPTYTMTPIS